MQQGTDMIYQPRLTEHRKTLLTRLLESLKQHTMSVIHALSAFALELEVKGSQQHLISYGL